VHLPAVSAQADCPPDVAEPNDNVATAYYAPCLPDYTLAAWPTGLDPPGDIDYYAFDAAAGQAVTVSDGGGSGTLERVLSFYAPGGVTLLEERRYFDYHDSLVSTVVEQAGTYDVAFASPTGDTGNCCLQLRCRDLTTPPPPVGNTLRAVKAAGNVSLAWEKPEDTNLDPPTSFEVWRALPTTNIYYEPMGPTTETSFDAGPVTGLPEIIWYRVRALNAIGPDGPPPSVVRIDLLPDVTTILDVSLPCSTDPCASPNLHPQLPYVVTVSLTDRFGVPLDGYTIDIEARSVFRLGTFCPAGPDPFHLSGETGSAGPGLVEVPYSFTPNDLNGPDGRVEFRAGCPDFGPSDDRAVLEWTSDLGLQ
jgi:hypothetical protein